MANGGRGTADRHRGRWRPRLMILALAAVALLVWVVGIVGLGQAGEDRCLLHPPAGATGFETETSALPPRLTCVYATRDGGTLEVHHHVDGTLAALWLAGFPLVTLAGLAVLTVRMARGPHAGRPERRPWPTVTRQTSRWPR